MTNRVPEARDNYRLLERSPSLASRVPKQLRMLIVHSISKALEPDLERRYSSAGALVSDLESLAARQSGRGITGLAEYRRTIKEAMRRARASLRSADPTLISIELEGQVGWYRNLSKTVSTLVVLDRDYDGFMVGFSFGTMPAFRKHRRSAAVRQMQRDYGESLHLDAPTGLEDGGAVVFTSLIRNLDEAPEALVERILDQWRYVQGMCH